jgi:AcrR family transcriptional regulator
MAKASMSKRRQKAGGESAVRERILEAAFTAFMKNGYATASTLEIATRARVSKRVGLAQVWFQGLLRSVLPRP